jgi:hypothetical protein
MSAGALSLLCAVVAYYAVDLSRGVYETVDGRMGSPLTLALSDLRLWAAAALLAGPVLGVVGANIKPGRGGLACALVVPAGAATEMSLLLVADAVGDQVTAVTRTAVLLSAVVVAAALLWRFPRTREADTVPRRASEAS